jgi:hypothetical protein
MGERGQGALRLSLRRSRSAAFPASAGKGVKGFYCVELQREGSSEAQRDTPEEKQHR